MFWPLVQQSLATVARKGEDFHSYDELTWSAHAGDAPIALKVFGVYDGHGGTESADLVKNGLVSEFMQQLSALASSAPRGASSRCHYEQLHIKAVQAAFVKLDEQCRQRFNHSGTTATLVLILQEQVEDDSLPVIPGNARRAFITVANVGDSSVYLDNGAIMTRLNEEHRAGASKSELKRVAESGGSITREDAKSPYRLYPGGLMMTRTIGDRDAHQAIAEPAIVQIALRVESGGGGGRLILASDGLWDAVAPKECGSMTRKMKSASSACKALLKEATKREGRDGDDVTIFVIDISDASAATTASPFQRTLHSDSAPNRPFYIWRPLHDNAPDYVRHLQAALNEGLALGAPVWFRERETVVDTSETAKKEYKVTVCEGPFTLLQNKGWVPTNRLVASSQASSSALAEEQDPATRLAIEAALQEEEMMMATTLAAAPERIASPPWEEKPVSRSTSRKAKITTEEKTIEPSGSKKKPSSESPTKEKKERRQPSNNHNKKRTDKKPNGPSSSKGREESKEESATKADGAASDDAMDLPERSHDLFAVGFPDEWTESEIKAYFERYSPLASLAFKVNADTKERAVFLTFTQREDLDLEERVCGRHIINTSHMYVVRTKDAFEDVLSS